MTSPIPARIRNRCGPHFLVLLPVLLFLRATNRNRFNFPGRVKFKHGLLYKRCRLPGFCLLLLLAIPLPADLSAQGPGRIASGGRGIHWKIPTENQGEWRVLDTLHFRIHYPAGQEALAESAARYSEQTYARLTRILQHRMRAAIPVFLFASHQDFAAANFFSGSPSESTGGFTDFSRRRVVVPFNGDYAALRHVLAHEIVHAFQFEILPGPFYNIYPLWLIEGMAEYLTLGWDNTAETYVRDLVLHSRLPGLGALQRGANRSGYDNYKVGQAIFWYMARRYGEERIGFFLKEIAATGDLRAAFDSACGTTPEEFDFEFAAFLNAYFAPAFSQIQKQTDKTDARVRIASFRYHPENHLSDSTGFHLHPVISPDGRRMAYITASGPFPAIAIKAVPGPGVTRAAVNDVTLVLRALRSPDYESYQPLTTRLSWSPDGRRILLAGRRAGRQALLLIDVEAENIAGSFAPSGFDALHYPVFSNNGSRIAFTGVVRGQADLYVLDIARFIAEGEAEVEVDGSASRALTRLTRDRCYEMDPHFSPDGASVYFSANCDASSGGRAAADSGDGVSGDSVDRHIFRVAVPRTSSLETPENISPPITQITRMPGRARHPQPAVGGSLIFSSDFTGVRNMYRIPAKYLAGSPGTPPVIQPGPISAGEMIALTRSSTGIEHAALTIVAENTASANDFQPGSAADSQDAPPPAEYDTPPPAPGEYLVFTEREEGALELKVLPPGIGPGSDPDIEDPAGGATPQLSRLQITPVTLPSAATRTFAPADYQMPIALAEYAPELFNPPLVLGMPYEPALSFDGVPYLFVGGGTDADGETRIAGLAAARLADDTGDHQVFGLVGYGESPPEWTVDLRYSYLRYRPDFFVGVFRDSGAFPVATFFDLNLNNILYDPNFRVLDQDTYGAYGGVEYPLSKFSSLSAIFEAGQEEILFRARESNQREQDDVATEYYSAGLRYRFDNTVYGRYGPIDGQGILLSYTIPIRPSGDEREVYALVADYRLHHWFSNNSIFAARAFAGGVGGQDATDYPFRIGGFATIRGYDFQDFEGRYSFFANLEYRFPLIKYLLFGFPFDWSPGWVRGVLFFDGGAAFDEPGEWQAYESRTRATRDLYLSYGAGVHFENILWFLFPGVVMKVEWATPYDLRISEPPRKWQGVFSIGFNF